jgi:AbiU2
MDQQPKHNPSLLARVTTVDEFEKLQDKLAADIMDALTFFKLCINLSHATAEYDREMAESRTFWSLTITALLNATLASLTRVYDMNKQSLGLGAWLNCLKAHPEFFHAKRVTEGDEYDANAHLKSLGCEFDDTRAVSVDDKDLELLAKTDPLVERLTFWRDRIQAHTDWREVLEPAGNAPLGHSDVDALIKRAHELLNKYSQAFNRNTWSPRIVGEDDYRGVLNAIHDTRARPDQEIASEGAGESCD